MLEIYSLELKFHWHIFNCEGLYIYLMCVFIIQISIILNFADVFVSSLAVSIAYVKFRHFIAKYW